MKFLYLDVDLVPSPRVLHLNGTERLLEGAQDTPPEPLTPDQTSFYSAYDPSEGVTTAVVLGGFFVFVCLMVVYKVTSLRGSFAPIF